MIPHGQCWVTNHGIFIHSQGPGSSVGSEMSHHLLHGSLGLWPPSSPRSPLRPLGYSLAKNGYFYDRNQKLWE